MCLSGINGMVGFRYLSPAHLQGFSKYKVSETLDSRVHACGFLFSKRGPPSMQLELGVARG